MSKAMQNYFLSLSEASDLAKGAPLLLFLCYACGHFFQHSTFPMFPTDLSLRKLSLNGQT